MQVENGLGQTPRIGSPAKGALQALRTTKWPCHPTQTHKVRHQRSSRKGLVSPSRYEGPQRFRPWCPVHFYDGFCTSLYSSNFRRLYRGSGTRKKSRGFGACSRFARDLRQERSPALGQNVDRPQASAKFLIKTHKVGRASQNVCTPSLSAGGNTPSVSP